MCAYPMGDKEAYEAVRSIALWRGHKDDSCVRTPFSVVCMCFSNVCGWCIHVGVCMLCMCACVRVRVHVFACVCVYVGACRYVSVFVYLSVSVCWWVSKWLGIYIS